MRTGTSLAKLTRPKAPPGAIRRTRLFKALDDLRRQGVIWVMGPPGAGKTTLIGSYVEQCNLNCLWYQLDAGDADPATLFHYLGLAAQSAAPRRKSALPHLTAEYLPNLAVFTRRFFEQLYDKLTPPALVVFDNYHDLPLDAPLHQIVQTAFSVLPAGVEAIVLSRAEPPEAFARLRASGSLSVLGWDDLKLTPKEAREIAQGRMPHLSGSTLTRICDQSQGWAAGLILALARGNEIDSDLSTPQVVFDYFAAEIFRDMDETRQKILLQCAFLPEMTTSQAESLTGTTEAGRLLQTLHRRGYFTLKHADVHYQFHPLFREFLLSRATLKTNRSELKAVRTKAAAVLQESGRIEDAAVLLIDGEDWTALAALIAKTAQEIASQGRSKTLEKWIHAVPEDVRNQNGWLLYWLGICRLAFDPRESRNHFENAFTHFKKEADWTGTFLAWASIVDTFSYEWSDFHPLDHWIALCEELLSAQAQPLAPEVHVRVAVGMLTAMTYRQPTHPDLSLWAERVERILLRSDNIPFRLALGNQLIFYYIWVGDFSRAPVVIDALRPSGELKEYDPLSRQTWHVMQAMYSWSAADWPTCLKAITDGMENAEESGVHLLDLYLLAQGVYGGLSLGDSGAADACLQKMSAIGSPRLGDKALYQYQVSSAAWFHGNLRRSAKHGKHAVEITEEMGWVTPHVLCLVDQSATLFDHGQKDEAKRGIARALELSRGMVGLEFHACLNGARFAFEEGEEVQGTALLTNALRIGAKHDLKNIPRWNDVRMAHLLAKALELKIEPHYVRRLIRFRGLLPDESMQCIDDWPWLLKVYTLGRLRIVKEDTPLELSTNVQQKPLDLLKALIAFGGAEVAEANITDALWPDAEGDRAQQNLKVTVHRLRKTLDSDEVLRVANGLISLDRRRVWVDVWGLEHALESLESAVARHDSPAALASFERVVSHGNGLFLEGDSSVWAISARERLRGRFMRICRQATELLISHRPAAAIPAYERAIEADPTVEFFYQAIMRCYLTLGRWADGLAVYDRCRDLLGRQLNLLPSPATELLREELQKQPSSSERP